MEVSTTCAAALVNAASLHAKVSEAKARLTTAEGEMERALQEIAHAPREDKSIIGAALSTALGEMKAARKNLDALEQVIAEE